MDNSLSTKLEKVKDDHAQEALDRARNEHAEREKADALFVLGRIAQNDHISKAIAHNLDTQTILALQRFQQEKAYRALGFETFEDFLDKSEYSRITKRQYYDRLAIINTHGPDVADLLTSVGISMRSQKLLGAGDIEIKDDRVYVAGREVGSAGSGEIKDLVVEFVDEIRQKDAEIKKVRTENEKLQQKIKVGERDIEILQRKLDDATQLRPFDRSLMMSVHWQLSLLEHVGDLPDKELKQRGYDDLKLLAGIFFRLREAYKIDLALTDFSQRVDNTELDNKINEILADGDLSEVEE